MAQPDVNAPTIRVLGDAESVSEHAAREVVRLARDAIVARGRFSIVLSGGTTPRRLFELLAEPPFRDQIDWSQVEIFWGDERAVPPNHPDSNYGMAKTALLDKVQIPSAHIHRMMAERDDRDAAADDYQAELARAFGVSPDGPPPRLDLVLLGLGADAHTASLFPHSPALAETARWVVPNASPAYETPRLTLTPAIINQAAAIVFMVVGKDKAVPTAEVLEGPRDPERYPAQLIHPDTGTVMWLVDRAASRRLSSIGRPSEGQTV